MGEVWEAEHVELGRRVAVKLLHPRVAEVPVARARFLREARVAAGIRHPHVVQVLDLGELEDGLPFMVMELLDGEDLEAQLEQGWRFDLEEALGWLEPVASALDALHARGILHRDVKPSNVFLARDAAGQTVKLVDFGIVYVANAAEKLTRADIVVGTPHYLPPEACEGASYDVRGDVYSLACVAYEMLTGCVPIDDDTPMGLMTAKVLEDAPAPSTRIGGIGADVDAVFAAALSRDPDDRPASAGELVARLRAAVVPSDTTAVRPRADPKPNSLPAPPLPPRPRRRAPLALGLMAGLAMVLALGAYGAARAIPEPRVMSVHAEPELTPRLALQTALPRGLDVGSAPSAAAASIPPAVPQTPAPRESAAAPRAASTPPSCAHDALRGRRIEPPAIDEAPTEAAPVAEVEAAGPDPAYALALRRRGQRALLEGRVREAATQLLEATRSAPTDADAWRALGLAYEQLGRPDEARRAYGRVLHLLPGDAATRARLERL